MRIGIEFARRSFFQAENAGEVKLNLAGIFCSESADGNRREHRVFNQGQRRLQRLSGDEKSYSELDMYAGYPRKEVRFLGVELNPMTLPELNALVELAIRERHKWIVANHNLHSLYLFHKREFFRLFYARVDWTAIDGMSLVALGRLYGYALARGQRVTYVDWTPRLIELAAERGWRVFYLGGKPGVAERGVTLFKSLHPSLVMEACDGFFDARQGSQANEEVLRQIDEFKPDLLFVGMGMPRQEFWIDQNFDRLPASVVLPCGAAIDYFAQAVPTPPRWAGKIGLEWMFRFFSEPRRLFTRYLMEPWYVLFLVAKDFLKIAGRAKSRRA